MNLKGELKEELTILANTIEETLREVESLISYNFPPSKRRKLLRKAADNALVCRFNIMEASAQKTADGTLFCDLKRVSPSGEIREICFELTRKLVVSRLTEEDTQYSRGSIFAIFLSETLRGENLAEIERRVSFLR